MSWRMGEKATVLSSYARRYGLSGSQRELLRNALNGLRGEKLATAMRIGPSELSIVQKLFRARTGRTVAQAVNEIEAVARTRSSRPGAPRPGQRES